MNLRIHSIQISKILPAPYMIALLIVLLESSTGLGQRGGSWDLVSSPNPSINASRLKGTVAISANDVWAVGHQVSNGSFENLAMHWNGSHWTVVPTPRADVSPTNQMKKLVALSSNNVWAVGGHEYAYTMHWNGSDWSVVHIGSVPGGTTPALNDISAVSANDIWAVGQYASDFGRVSTVIMHWQGSAWARVPSPDAEVVPGSPRSSFLWSVEAISANNVWAVGEYLVGNKSFPLVEHWDGTQWSIVPSPSHSTTVDGRLFSIRANSATDIWAVGEHDISNFNNYGKSFAMHWNGSQWTFVNTPQPTLGSGASRLSGVTVLSTNNVWAVGTAASAPNGLSTFIIHWDGSQWSRVTSPDVPPGNSTGWNQLLDISAVSSTDIWTVGYGQPTFGTPDVTVTAHFTGASTHSPKFDFDGDGQSDIAVFRPSNSVWYLQQSTAGYADFQFGVATDLLVPADYDGDGKSDVAVFRNGAWYWLNSSSGGINAVQFGQSGDVPVPADFSGDGRAELAVYRSGTWHTLNLTTNQFQSIQFGTSTDKPVPADFDGDDKTDVAVYRDGTWYCLKSSDNEVRVVEFGIASDKLVVGDYDGDGKADQAVYRAGRWYVMGSLQGFSTAQFGLASDIPVAADYDGDGKTDLAVYRDGTWYMLRSQLGFTTAQFGLASDSPIPAAFVR